MSSAGHVLDMNNRIKQNEALKKARRERTNSVRDLYRSKLRSSGIISMRNCDLPKEKMDVIRKQIRSQLIRQQQVSRIKSISLLIILLALIAWGIDKYIVTLFS